MYALLFLIKIKQVPETSLNIFVRLDVVPKIKYLIIFYLKQYTHNKISSTIHHNFDIKYKLLPSDKRKLKTILFEFKLRPRQVIKANQDKEPCF